MRSWVDPACYFLLVADHCSLMSDLRRNGGLGGMEGGREGLRGRSCDVERSCKKTDKEVQV